MPSPRMRRRRRLRDIRRRRVLNAPPAEAVSVVEESVVEELAVEEVAATEVNPPKSKRRIRKKAVAKEE